MERPFWLFSAGEDSGDILGESVVREFLDKNFDAVGVGGVRMQKAGLKVAFPFDDLPVNGFCDIFCHAKKLKRDFFVLKKLLENENCRGLVAIDYPGFNLKLMKKALALGKRVVYVEPPQIWAWKPGRIQNFLSETARANVEIRALFDVECKAYRKFGLQVLQIPHPFDRFENSEEVPRERLALLFPGSRKAQIRRNLKLYTEIAYKLNSSGLQTQFVASRAETFETLSLLQQGSSKKIPVVLSPESALERFRLLKRASLVIAGPGSAVVEAFKARTPCVAVSRIDALTYALGKRFLKTRFLTIPNIERDACGKPPVIPEIVKSSLFCVRKQAQSVLAAAKTLRIF